MLMAPTRFGVSAGRFTSFRIISRSRTECFHSSQAILRRVRFRAVPTNRAQRSALVVAIGRLHAPGRSKCLEMGYGCGYRFGCRSVPIQLSVGDIRASRLCGHVSLWIHCLVRGEKVAAGPRDGVSLCVALPQARLLAQFGRQRAAFSRDAPVHRPVGM
jgi:hypothetical protein